MTNIYIYILYIVILVRHGGFFTTARISKSLFSNPFFFYLIIVISHPRIEFSPANTKKRREHVLQKLCSVSRVFSTECVLYRTCSPENMVFTTSLTKRGDLEIPTKSALLFFVRGKKRKNFSYFFLVKKQFLPLH